MTSEHAIEQIFNAFATCGHLDYGEHISMQEHMLQAACLAERAGEPDEVVVAALLHDYGHLVCNLPNSTFADGIDNKHEVLGAAALSAWFDDDIVQAVRLHVAAKRYLCGATPSYRDKLSPASVTTLTLQGGPMSDAEMSAFREQPGYRLALKVRLYDDLGKEPAMDRPELEHYLPKLEACLSER